MGRNTQNRGFCTRRLNMKMFVAKSVMKVSLNHDIKISCSDDNVNINKTSFKQLISGSVWRLSCSNYIYLPIQFWCRSSKHINSITARILTTTVSQPGRITKEGETSI